MIIDIVDAAEKHIASKGLRGRTPVHHCTRWVRLTGITDPHEIEPADFPWYRSNCLAIGLSPRSIEGSINDVAFITHSATGRKIDIGERLTIPRPRPTPSEIDSINSVYPLCEKWVQQWMALSYWTAMRLTDSLDCLREISGQELSVIEWRASKTRHLHRWPVPIWLRDIIRQNCTVPTGKSHCHLADKLRLEITLRCQQCEVPRILPKHIRQRSITQWKIAGETAGDLIHGKGLGVLNHYVDPLSVITAAAPRVKLPDCFGARDTQPDVLPLFQRLDPAGQSLILSTMERLV